MFTSSTSDIEFDALLSFIVDAALIINEYLGKKKKEEINQLIERFQMSITKRGRRNKYG